MDKIENYPDVNGRISATADFILHCIKMAQSGIDAKIYLNMARETTEKLIDINTKSWNTYRHINFGIKHKT